MTRTAALLLVLTSLSLSLFAEERNAPTRVVIENGEWKLIGDLTLPAENEPAPAVLLLNKAAGNRIVYRDLANQLSRRGIASLALDLRGHGESTNAGRFAPGPDRDLTLISESHKDVIAAIAWLKHHARIDPSRIAVIGGSYSGEEMVVAARQSEYEKAYVALSPGSFSDESIDAIDTCGAAWLLVVSRDERYLKEVTEEARKRSHKLELWELPGTKHATELLEDHPDLAARIATWLAARL